MVSYLKERCLYCGGCVSVCPKQALELMETEIKYYRDRCINCNACVKLCPLGAIEAEKPEGKG
jgi:formate hydrogenlyase subunit 6/NADH:ubiquinone oxidoreductase subunit I